MADQNAHSEKVPLPFLLAACGLVALTLFLVSTREQTGLGVTAPAPTEALAIRDLRFEDRPNGAIAIYAGEDRRLIETLEPGTNGFLRGTLRALVRERRQHGVTAALPFRLIRGADGSLILNDPAIGRRIDLRAFGPTNAGVFASLLTSGTEKQ